MSNTLEVYGPTAEQLAAARSWKMPKPTLGQQVLFFHRGTLHRDHAEVAFVTRVGDRCVDLNYRNTGCQEVFHVDDPRLKLNPDLRKDIPGTWMFTHQDQAQEARLVSLENRLAHLEAQLKPRA